MYKTLFFSLLSLVRIHSYAQETAKQIDKELNKLGAKFDFAWDNIGGKDEGITFVYDKKTNMPFGIFDASVNTRLYDEKKVTEYKFFYLDGKLVKAIFNQRVRGSKNKVYGFRFYYFKEDVLIDTKTIWKPDDAVVSYIIKRGKELYPLLIEHISKK